ncbi:hypothetical protein AVEN_193696-1 [Araneus ventricosus]|uniref:Uncharacterized protein n=1 Tax=Araneus ventricosus TaxID=182803 RepID=A0A4Y2V6J1_ARAVE|nr:hypothetical protein AVEN_193696-1 [Araneus ventricosus]
MVRSPLRCQRFPGSKPLSTEDPSCTWVRCTLFKLGGQNGLPLVLYGVKRECQLRCRPRHLTVVQNYEVRPKIALVFLQNGTLRGLGTLRIPENQ